MSHCELLKAESRDAIPLLAPRAQLIATSPPYNVGKDYADTQDMFSLEGYLFAVELWFRLLFENAPEGCRLAANFPKAFKSYEPCCWSTHSSSLYLLPIIAGLGWKPHGEITWSKYGKYDCDGDEMTIPGTAWGSFGSPSNPSMRTATEHVWLFSKGDWGRRAPEGCEGKIIESAYFAACTNDLWIIQGATSKDHPAVMATEVARRLVTLLSFPGDVVYDPFCGSGTVPLAAAALGRVGVGSDISEEYIRLCQRNAAQQLIQVRKAEGV